MPGTAPYSGPSSDPNRGGYSGTSIPTGNGSVASLATNAWGPQDRPDGWFDKALDRWVPVVIGAGAAAITGGAAGAIMGPALAGTTAGAIGAGAASGAVGSAVTAGAQDRPVTWGTVGKGALVGGATAGLGNSGPMQNLKYGMTDVYGVPTWAANGAIGGLTGAGTGALNAGLHGQNIWRGALNGSITGAASSAARTGVNDATGGPGILGDAAGIGAGMLARKYFTPTPHQPTAPPPPATPAAPPPGSAAPAGVTSPADHSGGTPGQPPPPGSTNPYSGYGYAPVQQTNPSIDYSTYGQGPEASFFKPVGT